MYALRKQPLVFLVATALLLSWSALPAMAETRSVITGERSAGAMAVDLVAIRPLGIVATVVGFGVFIISSPFSLLGGNVGEAWENLMVDPATFTFVRPLGAETK